MHAHQVQTLVGMNSSSAKTLAKACSDHKNSRRHCSQPFLLSLSHHCATRKKRIHLFHLFSLDSPSKDDGDLPGYSNTISTSDSGGRTLVRRRPRSRTLSSSSLLSSEPTTSVSMVTAMSGPSRVFLRPPLLLDQHAHFFLACTRSFISTVFERRIFAS